MNKELKHFVSELSRLEPAHDDFSLEQTLYELVDTIEGEDASPVFDQIFAFFERFPNAQHGSPGPLVHLVERSLPAYLGELVLSIQRRPAPHTLWMLNRVLNSEIPAAQRAEFMALLEASTRHPLADEIARQEATEFLRYQRGRPS